MPASISRFEVPPPGFDPKIAGGEQLQRYGVLARPTAESSEQYQRLWNRTFASRPDFVAPEFKTRKRYRRTPAQRRQTFNNWAGLAVRTSGAPFITVAGTWTVPNPHVPDDAAGNEPNYNSAWIGIDGFSSPSENDILQAGVDFNFMPGSSWIEVSPWWEWWPGDELLH